MIIGHNPEIMKIKKIVRDISLTDTNLLIIGQNGTGKEYIAREIHKRSKRRNRPFISLCCRDVGLTINDIDLYGSIAEEDNEIKRTIGLFEKVKGGTLYLDHLHELPAYYQKQFISIFTQKRFQKIGDSLYSQADFRIIGSTSDTQISTKKEFRNDLYSFISNVVITVPPLSQRKQDIPLLLYHFIKVFSKETECKLPSVSTMIFESLMEYSWPGNVSELKNTVKNLILMSPDEELSTEYLPFEIKKHPLEFLDKYKLKDAVAEVEYYLIKKNLQRFAGNQSKAARALNISEAAFRYKMKKFGLSKDNY